MRKADLSEIYRFIYDREIRPAPFGKKHVEATFAAYENLWVMLYAAKFCKLEKFELDNIFFNNAPHLFKL